MGISEVRSASTAPLAALRAGVAFVATELREWTKVVFGHFRTLVCGRRFLPGARAGLERLCRKKNASIKKSKRPSRPHGVAPRRHLRSAEWASSRAESASLHHRDADVWLSVRHLSRSG
eukprot:5478655-Pyramimonas_sp.AAC.1